MFIDRAMDKEDLCVCVCVCVYDGILLNHQKNKTMPFEVTWVNLEIGILSEGSQTEKDKYYTLWIICVI